MFLPETPIERLGAIMVLRAKEEVSTPLLLLTDRQRKSQSEFGVESDIETNIDLGANGSSEECLNGRINIANILDTVANHPWSRSSCSSHSRTR
ncbi:hypothetical protein BASA60_000598 [Batrachochytrium salamandrivorans]|nr:hypothetical protein BASA60_000598 [Batrachochytrium salamandrivorans]